MRSFLVTSASTRPLYCLKSVVVGLLMVYRAISGTFESPLLSPGLVGLIQVRSCVPSPVVSGDPMFKPWPGMVTQLTPSLSPACVQVAEPITVPATCDPGKLRYVEAMLFLGARPA